jgi:hypothetical protein
VGGHDRWAWVRDRRLSERERGERGGSAAHRLWRDDPLWPGQVATLAALLLFLALPEALTIGPNWPLPAAELALLAVLVVSVRGGRDVRRRRELAISVVLLAAFANLIALGLLVHYLLVGGHARGSALLGGGVVIWVTNLLLFTVLFWELDRGGPLHPADRVPVAPDFLFPQMTDERYATAGWTPRFGDYFYVSLTNQTAFSPTDTMPLTLRVKAAMGAQGLAAFITAGVIVARAVNLLG